MAILIGLGVFFFVILAVLVVLYILMAIATMKALKALGYDYPWFAWIPFVSDLALMDITGEENWTIGGAAVPMNIARFWWVLLFVTGFVPAIGYYLTIALCIMFRGWAYGKIFALLEDKDASETQVIGYVSGFISIIAMVKFFQDTK